MRKEKVYEWIGKGITIFGLILGLYVSVRYMFIGGISNIITCIESGFKQIWLIVIGLIKVLFTGFVFIVIGVCFNKLGVIITRKLIK